MEFRVLQGVPPADVRAFLAMARKRSFDRDEVVFHHGDVADAVHLIVRGRFALRIVSPIGESAMLAVRGPGESFGELACFRAYYLVRLDDATVTFTVCDDEAGTAESTRVAGEWLRENLPDVAGDPPMVSSGTVTLSA